MPQPKILLETSVLGYASHGSAYRTGVFRMVEEWAKELAHRQDIQLNFGSFLDEHTSLRTSVYCNKDSALCSVPFFPHSRARDFLRGIDEQFLALAQNAQPGFLKKLYRRALKESVDLSTKFLKSEKVLEKNTFEIFHSTFWPFPARSKNTKYVMTFVDLINLVRPDLSSDGGQFFKTVLSKVEPQDFTVSISEATRKDLLSLRPDLDPKKSFVVPLAASSSFQPLNPVGVKKHLQPYQLEAGNYILSVCTLEKRKNLPFLIEAFAKWTSLSRFKNQKLVLTGSKGSGIEQIQQKIREHHLEDKVKLLGYVPDTELMPLYAGAMAFVLPSLYEGFGIPILEAMQSGTLVITSDNSSMPEVGGKAAFYIDATRIDSLVQALEQTAETNRQERIEMGLKQASQFSWKKSVDKLITVYRQMVPQSSIGEKHFYKVEKRAS